MRNIVIVEVGSSGVATACFPGSQTQFVSCNSFFIAITIPNTSMPSQVGNSV